MIGSIFIPVTALLAEVEKEHAKNLESLKKSKEELEQVKTTKAQEEKSDHAKEKEIADLQSELGKLETAIREMGSAEEYQKELNHALSQIQTASAALSDVQKQNQPMEGDYNRAHEKMNAILEMMSGGHTKYEDLIKNKEKELKLVEGTLLELARRISALETDLAEIENKKETIIELKDKVDTLSAKVMAKEESVFIRYFAEIYCRWQTRRFS